MIAYDDLIFEPFCADDIQLFTQIMTRSFDEDAKRHLNVSRGGPPGYDNGDFLRKWALDEGSQAMKVLKDGCPIGLFIVWICENGENFLGNLFVDSDVQDKGIGTEIWKFIESHYAGTKIWRTETPGFSKRNHHFYVNKCGFSIFKIENCGHRMQENYLMEKRMDRVAMG